MAAWVGVFAVEFIALILVTVYILRRYALEDTHWSYLVGVGVSWFLGFLGTLLLPLDIGNHNGDDPVLQASWLVVYWVTFVLSWGVLPLQQEYYASGEFTFRRRLCQSLRINIAIYAAMALIGGGVIIWMMVKQVTGSLPLLGVLTAAGNAWGLLLIVVMLGYGLVEVPRALWKSSSLSGQKKRLQFHAPAVDSAFFEANSEMADIVQVLRDFDRLVPQDPHSTEDRELRGRMNEVMVKVPDVEAFPHAPARGKQRTEVPSLKELANWHGKLIKARGKLSRAHARWDTLVKRVMEIEALEAATAPATSDAAAGALGRSAWALRVDHVRWVWRKRVASPMYKVAAVCCGLASFAVLFGEVTIPSKIDVSPMGMLVAAAEPDMTMMSLMALLPLSYMCVCAYLSLFRMKFFDVIELSDHKMTDPYSLCFNGIYLCRMQFALMFNYIYVLHRDDPSHESAFEATIGAPMHAITTVIDSFNEFVPIACTVVAVLTLLNLFERLLRLLHIDQADSPREGNPEHEEIMEQGRLLLQKGRREQRNLIAAAASATGATPARGAASAGKPASSSSSVQRPAPAPAAAATASRAVPASARTPARDPGGYTPPPVQEIRTAATGANKYMRVK